MEGIRNAERRCAKEIRNFSVRTVQDLGWPCVHIGLPAIALRVDEPFALLGGVSCLAAAATIRDGAAIGCCRVANGYPEVCLIASLVDATTLVSRTSRTVDVRKRAQSRLREAHLEEARP